MTAQNSIGKNIKRLRQKANWNQRQAAERLGISIAAYSKIETGITEINISRLKQIADLFGVDYMIILDGVDDQTRIQPLEEIRRLASLVDEKDKEIRILELKVTQLLNKIGGQ